MPAPPRRKQHDSGAPGRPPGTRPARAGRLAAYLLVPLVLALLLAPIGVLVVQAASRSWFYPQVIPEQWSLGELATRVSDPDTQQALWTGLGVSIAATLLALLLGVPAARVLGTRAFPGRWLALAVLTLPIMIPPPAVGVGLNIAFLRLGLAGDALGVVLAHLLPTLPYVVLPLLGVFAGYDEGFETQARSLGAGPWSVLVRVSLPLLAPGIAVAALFGFLASWSQYTLTLLVGGGQVITLPVLVFSAASGGNPATAATLALLLALPAVLAVAVAARVVRGAAVELSQP